MAGRSGKFINMIKCTTAKVWMKTMVIFSLGKLKKKKWGKRINTIFIF